ncbi:solute carrier family 35 member F5 isoform X3 [Rhinoderma darwinii]|uniref:solute carrier family 35 member F5 isoform X3 n=1 Tax=Rhinoderma darwinii TaxID=43563 RepID=UPI003F66D891
MNRVISPGSSSLPRRRLLLGILVLLLVDVIWVASSELTSQCTKRLRGRRSTLFADVEGYFPACAADRSVNHTLSEPLYVPIKFHDLQNEEVSTSNNQNNEKPDKKPRVRFSNLMEVRQLPSSQALEAKLSRMSHLPVRDSELGLRTSGKFTICQVAKISFFFCFVWFLANYSYQEALSDTQVAIVNIISSTSGLFTLILASIFPSNSGDRFTLSKLLAVVLSIGGVVLVSLSGSENSRDKDTIGSLWSLLGAVLYAVYIVMIKRKVDREEKLDIPMFFGFVGLFNLLLLWPGFFLLHYTEFEAFEFPNKLVWIYLVINGLVGTVLSEFLWLWGCFLTSSLVGTLALSLTIPLSIIADICMQKVSFSWVFFAGALPVFLSFFVVTLLCHYNNWDPVMVAVRRIFAFACRKHWMVRTSEDNEQSESLIPLHSVCPGDVPTSCS